MKHIHRKKSEVQCDRIIETSQDVDAVNSLAQTQEQRDISMLS